MNFLFQNFQLSGPNYTLNINQATQNLAIITSMDLNPVYMPCAPVLPPPDFNQWELEVPRAPDRPKGSRTVPIGSGTLSLYKYVCGMIV
jgi:hypothetical protein